MPEWLQNPVVIFGIAIAAMFFGYFFGLFEGRGQGYKRRKEEEGEKESAGPVPEPVPAANPVLPPDETPILDVSQSKSGALRLSLDGQRTDPTTLSAEQRKRLIEVLTYMRPWLETSKPAQPPQPPPPPAQPKPATAPQGTSSPQAAQPATAIPSPEPVPGTGERPTAPPVDKASPAEGEEKEIAPEPQSIVTQIDSILQTQMAGTPLAERGIRLTESAEGGVIVWVGIDKYQGVDEVPDDGIKAAIRAAIAEWENKYTPGP